MRHFVRTPDGNEYGPADIPTLIAWLQEGRILGHFETRPEFGNLPSTVTAVTTYSPAPTAQLPARKYIVLGPNGQQYSPVDPDTLTQWASEGRINHATQVMEEGSGIKMRAADVPGIVMAVNPAPYLTGNSLPPSYSPYPRPSYGLQSDVPHECRGGFNFGAFVFTWIWAGAHRTWWPIAVALLGFCIPRAGLVLAIYLGIKGNEIAWNSGRFSTPQECLATQRVWSIVGGVVLAVSIVVYVLVVLAAA